MNATIRDQWVAALRSGQHRQGFGRLVHRRLIGPYHCCLGVLCELAAQAGVVTRLPTCGSYVSSDGEVAVAYLPLKVRQWAGLPHDGSGLEEQVRTMNDCCNCTFAQIADVISTQPGDEDASKGAI